MKQDKALGLETLLRFYVNGKFDDRPLTIDFCNK
jgi:hypothetical protein